MPMTRIGALSSAIARIAQATAAPPAMSSFIRSMPSAGLIEMPPLSKVTPLPTSPSTGVAGAPGGSYRKTIRRGGSTLPRATPRSSPIPNSAIRSSSSTSTLMPASPAIAAARRANSRGVQGIARLVRQLARTCCCTRRAPGRARPPRARARRRSSRPRQQRSRPAPPALCSRRSCSGRRRTPPASAPLRWLAPEPARRHRFRAPRTRRGASERCAPRAHRRSPPSVPGRCRTRRASRPDEQHAPRTPGRIDDGRGRTFEGFAGRTPWRSTRGQSRRPSPRPDQRTAVVPRPGTTGEPDRSTSNWQRGPLVQARWSSGRGW